MCPMKGTQQCTFFVFGLPMVRTVVLLDRSKLRMSILIQEIWISAIRILRLCSYDESEIER